MVIRLSQIVPCIPDDSENNVKYIVTLRSAYHYYVRQVNKLSWLTIQDHLWNNPLFYHTALEFHECSVGQVDIWTDEFREGCFDEIFDDIEDDIEDE